MTETTKPAPLHRAIDGESYVLASACEFDRETAFARGWVKALNGQQYATHAASKWAEVLRYELALDVIAEARLWGSEPESDALILFAREVLGMEEQFDEFVKAAGPMAEGHLVNLRAALEELSR